MSEESVRNSPVSNKVREGEEVFQEQVPVKKPVLEQVYPEGLHSM